MISAVIVNNYTYTEKEHETDCYCCDRCKIEFEYHCVQRVPEDWLAKHLMACEEYKKSLNVHRIVTTLNNN